MIPEYNSTNGNDAEMRAVFYLAASARIAEVYDDIE